MQRTSTQILTFVVWLSLAVPGLLLVLRPSQVQQENRRLASFPTLSMASLVDAEFYAGISNWVDDHFPFRTRAAELQSRLVLAGWVSEPTGKVIIGRDGWLYFAESLKPECHTEAVRSRAVSGLRRFGTLLERHGKRFIFVIAPSKVSIHPEHLPDWSSPLAIARERNHQELRRDIAQEEALEFLNLYDEVTRLKTSATEPLYSEADTHWTFAAAESLPRAIVNQLSPGLYDPDSAVLVASSEKTADLTRMLSSTRLSPAERYATQRPGVDALPDSREDDGRFLRRFRHGGRGAELIEESVVMVFDSFAMAAILALPPYFADLTMLHVRLAKESDRLAREVAVADTVVLQLAEREACSFPAEHLTDPRLYQSLNARLAAGRSLDH